jgi:hypothetical protein
MFTGAPPSRLRGMDQLIERSQATAPFKDAVRSFVEGADTDRIVIRGFAPRVKVERVLAQLLAAEPTLQVERVSLTGRSGCSDFSGVLTVETGADAHQIVFTWCCRWRAEREGWTDYFGFPDQIRAAREFGWDCFHTWERRGFAAGAASKSELALTS